MYPPGRRQREVARRLSLLPLAGQVVTGNAKFTHRDVAQAIRDGGSDYLLLVKDNQPEPKAAIASVLHDDASFPPNQRRQKAAAEQQAQTLANRRHDVRGGSSARVLAALRNITLYLLEQVRAASKAAASRRLAAPPREAPALLI
jgi:predicted transposase YbfD/YdcC